MRDEILRNLRRAIEDGPLSRFKADRPDAGTGRLIPAGSSLPERIDRFAERAASSGSTVHRVKGTEAARKKIHDLLEGKGKVAIAGAAALSRRLGIPVTEMLPLTARWVKPDEFMSRELFRLDAALTDAVMGIAETGSVLLHADEDYTRLISLVPEMHIVLLWPDRIVPDLLDWSGAYGKTAGSLEQPGGFTLVSGPSKTADIELKLVVGVHGPASLHLIIPVEAEPPA
jgi:L-lactate utilization protein LutC